MSYQRTGIDSNGAPSPPAPPTYTPTPKLLGNDADLEALLNGEAQSDFDRVFGEELPGGLVLENS